MSIGNCFSELRPKQRRLVRMMQTLGYGRIEGLIVQSGQPVFKPMPKLMQEVRVASQDTSPLPSGGTDYALKAQVRQLLDRLEQMGDGRLEWLEVTNGLPFRFVVVPSEAIFKADSDEED